jgi:hypothetical protein
MRDNPSMQRYVHILVILAVILSGISPACAFISGKTSSVIEICTADGMKKIAVPSEQSPEQKPAKKIDCGFCFAQTHLKLMNADAVLITFMQRHEAQTVAALYSASITKFELSALAARAPPALS